MYPVLSLVAFRLLRSSDAAQDVVSDVFLHLWEHRAELGKVANLNAYLYVSTRNRTLNYLKRKSAGEALAEETAVAPDPSPEDFFSALLHTETVRALREAVDALPGECKKVTEYVLKGHPTSEIAQLLGISPSAVSHQKARAVRLLKNNDWLVSVLLIFF
jgi:RNA polymerase sigma-70 factor (ECF subfamily)